MADGLVNMGQQFSGLPMQDLIGSPLRAACDAQVMLAGATAKFINEVGFERDNKGNVLGTRIMDFKFNKPVMDEKGVMKHQEVSLAVPMLSIVNIPSLSVKSVDISFDMEVKSSFEEKSSDDKSAKVDAKLGWGPVSVSVSGSVSSHKENTRKSDNSAKYHVEVHALDNGMPEGLSRVLDILQSAIAPIDGKTKEIAPKPAPVTT